MNFDKLLNLPGKAHNTINYECPFKRLHNYSFSTILNMYTKRKYKYFTTFLYGTNATMNNFHITKESISLTLDTSKTHGWQNILIKMINICGESITFESVYI